MKIGIIGAGSIGLLLAAYLSKTFQVTVYTRTDEQAFELNENGIVLVKGTQHIINSVQACCVDHWKGTEDLTVITVKQYQLESILPKITVMNEKILNVLFLQNGMGHLKLLKDLKGHNLFVGTIEHGAYKENNFTVKHNGEGNTNLAVFQGDPRMLVSFAASVPKEFPVSLNDHYYEMLVNKLVVNAIVNPLTALLEVQNGMLLENEYYYHVLNRLFSEITSILNLAEPDFYFRRVVQVCKKTANNRSSMLKDIESGRKTEIDAILGFLLDEAKEQEKNVPLIQNIYDLVKGKEANSSNNWGENKNLF